MRAKDWLGDTSNPMWSSFPVPSLNRFRNYVIYFWSILEILQIRVTYTCRNPSGAALHVWNPWFCWTISARNLYSQARTHVFVSVSVCVRLLSRVWSRLFDYLVIFLISTHSLNLCKCTHTRSWERACAHTPWAAPSIACSPALWVSRCGVCVRQQGITSALNHVAPCLECSQCNHPAIFLTHNCQRASHTEAGRTLQESATRCSQAPTGPSQANAVGVLRRDFNLCLSGSLGKTIIFLIFNFVILFIGRSVNGGKKSWNSVHTGTGKCRWLPMQDIYPI